mmetsp:Transcript_19579/g.57792  ORF Transcript_19579/g.57792 Transcript_19579/m.57792 type:complete len:302 (+) Transcript_19579:174-1079(+)
MPSSVRGCDSCCWRCVRHGCRHRTPSGKSPGGAQSRICSASEAHFSARARHRRGGRWPARRHCSLEPPSSGAPDPLAMGQGGSAAIQDVHGAAHQGAHWYLKTQVGVPFQAARHGEGGAGLQGCNQASHGKTRAQKTGPERPLPARGVRAPPQPPRLPAPCICSGSRRPQLTASRVHIPFPPICPTSSVGLQHHSQAHRRRPGHFPRRAPARSQPCLHKRHGLQHQGLRLLQDGAEPAGAHPRRVRQAAVRLSHHEHALPGGKRPAARLWRGCGQPHRRASQVAAGACCRCACCWGRGGRA